MKKITRDHGENNVNKVITVTWDPDTDIDWDYAGFFGKAKLLFTSSGASRNKSDTNMYKDRVFNNINFIIKEVLQDYMWCKKGMSEVLKQTNSSGNYVYAVPYGVSINVTINRNKEKDFDKIMEVVKKHRLLSTAIFTDDAYKEVKIKIDNELARL